ncbi:hypothetical protein [Actinomyces sp. HMT897]|uniref:hypothetical protein n=1 Tax=Actinomyces sp. HMT897 TaxID=2789424 RepID=UPI00190B417D|nr:hypothetical protein [Actinomyces sp. HMT897]QQO78139.1 hypothetical protein JJJ15_01885 [Actinomyces sp. HMT897]
MATRNVNRTVRFLEVKVIDRDEHPVPGKADQIFDLVHTHCMAAPSPEHRSTRRNGLDYTGWASTADVVGKDFLIVGKKRSPVDNPSLTVGADMPQPLVLKGLLIEQAYVAHLSHSPYIAVMGTSGSPRPAAIADWMTHVSRLGDANLEVRLLPVMRKDAREKLRRAHGALGFTVKVPVSVDGSTGVIKRVLEASRGMAGGEGDVTFSFSLGHHKKGRDSESQLLDEVVRLSELPGAQKATARLLVDDCESTRTEVVDFISDRLTARAVIQCDDGTPLSHEEALRALTQAIWDNREYLSS